MRSSFCVLTLTISAASAYLHSSLPLRSPTLTTCGITSRRGFAVCEFGTRPVHYLNSRPRPARTGISLTATESSSNSGSSDLESPGPLRTYGLFAFWAAFIGYATFLAPTGDADIQQNMLKALFAPPPWDGANPIFAAMFMMLGVWPAVLGALLLPLKPKAQTLEAWPFVASSFALGAFSLTPYLALTSYTKGELDSDSAGAKLLGSTATGVALLASTVLLLLFALGVFAPNDLNGGSDYPVDVIFYTYLRNFGELFSTYKLVHVPACDFLAQWALSAVPLLEDMRRRRWYTGAPLDKALFAAFMLFPLLGPCLWLAVRPPLPAAPATARPAVVAEANGGTDDE